MSAPSAAEEPLQRAADAYVRFWQSLSPDTLDLLDRLPEVMAPDARFRDPFNDVRGLDRVRAVFDRTYRTLRDVTIEVSDRAFSGTTGTCYLRWVFSFRIGRSDRLWRIEGMSELHFDQAGRVTAHIDHWDAAGQIYETLPGLGWVLRRLRRRIEG